MTTLERKVTIPEDHRLRLELTLPDDIPPGEAEIRLVITPLAPERAGRKAFAGLAGSLKDSKTFGRDAVEMQREARDEW